MHKKNKKKPMDMEVNSLSDLKENAAGVLAERWTGKRVLLIDEAMMPSADLLADCEQRHCHCCCTPEMLMRWDPTKPFGGVLMLILVGDPSQLPPVNGHTLCESTGSRGQDIYRHILKHGAVVHLNLQMRQNREDPLVGVLSRMKTGDCTLGDAEHLNEHCGPGAPGNATSCYDEKRTHIFGTNCYRTPRCANATCTCSANACKKRANLLCTCSRQNAGLQPCSVVCQSTHFSSVVPGSW